MACPMGNGLFEKPLLKAAAQAPGTMVPAMKKAAKGICYMLLHTNLFVRGKEENHD